MPEGQHFADNIVDYIDKHCFFMDENGNELPPHTEKKWINISDRLPKEGKRVLVFGDDGVFSGCYRGENSWHCYEDGYISGVTHWMELPQEPKE